MNSWFEKNRWAIIELGFYVFYIKFSQVLSRKTMFSLATSLVNIIRVNFCLTSKSRLRCVSTCVCACAASQILFFKPFTFDGFPIELHLVL